MVAEQLQLQLCLLLGRWLLVRKDSSLRPKPGRCLALPSITRLHQSGPQGSCRSPHKRSIYIEAFCGPIVLLHSTHTGQGRACCLSAPARSTAPSPEELQQLFIFFILFNLS